MHQVIVRNKYHAQIAQCFIVDFVDANDLKQTVANRYRHCGITVDVISVEPIAITTALDLINLVMEGALQQLEI